MQGMLGNVVHFVAQRDKWSDLGTTQPCLCSTIPLGYWMIRRGGVAGGTMVGVLRGFGPRALYTQDVSMQRQRD